MKLKLVSLIFIFSFSLLANTQTAFVSGLDCQGCVDKVQQVFKTHKQVQSVLVDLKTGKLDITTKGDFLMNEAQIKALVEEAGFKISKVKN